MNNTSFLNPNTLSKQISIMPGSMVADFGAGTGRFAEIISKDIGSEGKIYLIDIQENILKRVQREFSEKNIKNAEFIFSDLEEKNGSKLKDKSVDLVLISAVLFQSLKREEILKEASRILKNNGRLLIIEWKACFSGIGPDEELIFKEEQILELMKKYPFQLERELNAGDYHYSFLFRKIN